MGNILSLKAFTETWELSHPNEKITKAAVEGVSIWSIIGVVMALIAVNILSASHSVPVFTATVPTALEGIKLIVAFAAFFGGEFFVFVLMLIPYQSWLRNILILLAVVVITIANIVSTSQALETSTLYGNAGTIVGYILGIFAPLANLGAGQILHHMRDIYKTRTEKVDGDYQKALKDRDTIIRNAYTRYLTKLGITDPTQILSAMNGQTVEEPQSAIAPQKPVSFNQRLSAKALAQKMRDEGTENLTYAQLKDRYGSSPNTIRDAKNLLK